MHDNTPVLLALKSAALSLALAACTVGPDHVRPDLPEPAAFVRSTDAQVTSGTEAGSPATSRDEHFWRSFDDPLLARLVEDALVHNHDLRIALASYDRANTRLRGAGFDRFPTVTASADASDGRASADQAPGAARDARDGEAWAADISAAWELDLFGRVRRNLEAGRADAAAAAGDLQAVQVALAGEVAGTYFSLRGAQERLRVAQDNADTQRDTLQLVQVRHDAGRDSEFDTARARAQLATTLAQVPALEADVAVAMHRLGVLTGQVPGALVATLAPAAALPRLPARIDPGTPGELLRRRPDVAAAEARLHAATARIGVATADLFPRFTLGGMIGSQAIDSGDLFTRGSETRLLAFGIDWSFLDVGRVRARIAASEAEAAGDLARYEQTVLLALEDTENALVRYGRARAEDAERARAATDSARAAELARVRFEAGATGLLDVLDAERTRLQAQDALAAARTRSTIGAVVLYRALAGGWPQALHVDATVADARVVAD